MDWNMMFKNLMRLQKPNSDEAMGSLFLVYINSSLGQLYKNRTGTLQ